MPKTCKYTARTADKHELYQLSVQAPENDSKFFARVYRKAHDGEPARLFREDFCGTAILSCEWAKLHSENQAFGIDLDGPTLDWGRKHNISKLKPKVQDRVKLIQDDVLNVTSPKVDIIAALNFSYSVFKERKVLLSYIKSCYKSLKPGGMLFLDDWGGSEAQVLQEENRPQDEGFDYVWDQDAFDPVTHDITCKIHFEFDDGSRMSNAFIYHWRLWSLPELQELMTEAGFQDVHVLWEGTEKGTDEGNGIFRRVTKGDADLAWIAYVVGTK
ncbi:MAG: class I SAM-dependent methyltransferase [Planctomycetota bacterium]|jgi:SAM-dependent methyltransferase